MAYFKIYILSNRMHQMQLETCNRFTSISCFSHSILAIILLLELTLVIIMQSKRIERERERGNTHYIYTGLSDSKYCIQFSINRLSSLSRLML